MRKTEFIQKYLGNPEFPFCDANREAMYDDLHRVVEHSNRLAEEFERMKKEYDVETIELDDAKQYPVVANGGPLDGQKLGSNNAASCCAYEERTDGSRCWNCGDPPKKAPLPKDYTTLMYLDVPSKNQNSDFSL